ncbi:MAG: DUF3568 family protein [Verrucomicrobiota bacterium]
MKHAHATALPVSAVAFTGCNTNVGVDNPDSREASANQVSGVVTTRYNAPVDNVFNAVKRSLDQTPGMMRTGESDITGPGGDNDKVGVKVFARSVGDLLVTVEIAKTEDKEKNETYTAVSIKYGNFGNLPESQKLISRISSNLRR